LSCQKRANFVAVASRNKASADDFLLNLIIELAVYLIIFGLLNSHEVDLSIRHTPWFIIMIGKRGILAGKSVFVLKSPSPSTKFSRKSFMILALKHNVFVMESDCGHVFNPVI